MYVQRPAWTDGGAAALMDFNPEAAAGGSGALSSELVMNLLHIHHHHHHHHPICELLSFWTRFPVFSLASLFEPSSFFGQTVTFDFHISQTPKCRTGTPI